MNCIVERMLRAKAELAHQKKGLRWLFDGIQNRKRGKEAQLESGRAERRAREKSEEMRREQPLEIIEDADLLMERQQDKENREEDAKSH